MTVTSATGALTTADAELSRDVSSTAVTGRPAPPSGDGALTTTNPESADSLGPLSQPVELNRQWRIRAVKGLCRQEQEDWWAAVVSDRVARSALFSLREEQRTFENWAAMAAWSGVDMNVVYGAAADADRKLGYFWTAQPMGRGAFLHFNLLSAAGPVKLEIGRYVLSVLWAAGYKCLVGLTPYFHRHVLAYVEALGFKRLGVCPETCYIAARNEWVDGIITQIIAPGAK